MLHHSLELLPKVVTKFHLAQEIVLPVFFFSSLDYKAKNVPHTLDVRRALLYYANSTKLQVEKALFMCYWGPKKGRAASSQSFSRWVEDAIHFCYEVAGKPYPLEVKAHSKRAQGSSAAFHRRVLLVDICKALTWSTERTCL